MGAIPDRRAFAAALALVVVGQACANLPPLSSSGRTAPATAAPPPAPAIPAPTHELAARPQSPRSLHLLVTSDEHGWLLPLRDEKQKLQRGGIAPLFEQLQVREGYSPGPAGRAAGYVLLSNGDMWTGPYESTVLEGNPMVAAMARMGYAAANIGNHEYDFGQAALTEKAATAPFPLLAANVVGRSSGQSPAWARPYVILDAGGVKLGVIGLTNFDSPVTSDPRNTNGLEFKRYADAINEWAPRARGAGAEELVVLLHDGTSVSPDVLPALRRNRVRAVLFGHHHVAASFVDDNGTSRVDDDVVVCNAGAYLRHYCRIDLTVVGDELVARAVKVEAVERPLDAEPATDPVLAAIVVEAEAHANRLGGEVLVENTRLLERGANGPLGQLVVDAWLRALPYAQVAVTNAGGIRQDLASGPVRTRDVVSVLPFNNTLIVVDMTGAQLKEVLASPESIVSGVRFTFEEGKDGRSIRSVMDTSGKPIADDARLKVIINDFMYRGGDRYRFKLYDAEPEETALDWREPLLRMLRELGRAEKKLDITFDERALRL